MDNNSTLFERFFCGTSTQEDHEALLALLESGEEGAFDQFCRQKWDGSADELPDEVYYRIKSELMTKLGVRRRHMWHRPRRSLVRKFTYVAMIAAVLVCAVFVGWKVAQCRTPEMFEIVAERGQKSTVTLPDGSKVWLNSATTISYSSDYNTKERNVYLRGEACFEVSPGEELPFVVHAHKLSVTAVGTKFNVKAYVEDNVITTTLVEGQVRTEVDGQKQMLYPNQEALYDKSTGVINKAMVNDEFHAIPWMRNEILFQGETLAEIAVILERMYNVNVIFADECVKSYSYTGLIRNNSLTNVLELISGTSPVDYRMTSDSIKFFMD